MKSTIKFFTIAGFFTMLNCGLEAFSQTPPPPPGGGGAGGSNNQPGGGAPIGGGLGILLALGAAYGIKKVYQFNKNNNE